MLTLLILIPIIGSLLLLPIGLVPTAPQTEGEESLNRNNNKMKKINQLKYSHE